MKKHNTMRYATARMLDQHDKYFNCFNTATGKYIGCVKADDEQTAKRRGSEKSGVNVNMVRVEERTEGT